MENTIFDKLKSSDDLFWKEALAALLSRRDPGTCDAVISLLSDPIWRKREAAAKALVEWGPEIIPHILEKLDENRIDEFYWLMFVLGHFEDSNARQRIETYLSHKNHEIRRYAVRAVTICRSLKNARLLYPMLSDRNWAVRKLVFDRLSTFGEMIIDDLKRMVFSHQEDPNHAMTALLIKTGSDEIIKELGKIFQESSFTLRYSIISALAENTAEAGLELVLNALSDPSWIIRARAAEILIELGTHVFDKLSARFSSADSIVKRHILHIIVELLKQKSLPIIRRFLESKDPEYRILGVESLKSISGDESARLMIKMLSDPNRFVSDYAAECLARKSNLNINLLLEHLNTDDENVRFLVIKTVGNIGGPALIPIIRILESGSKEESLFLLGVLQKVSPNQELIDTLVRLLSNPNWPVRNAAAACLISYGKDSTASIVKVLNDPSDDVRYWAKRILISIGSEAVFILKQILSEGADASLLPHIISALLSVDHAEAVPAVTSFLERTDDAMIEPIFREIPEVTSREIVDTTMNLLTHPDEKILKWLSFLLWKVKKPELRRIILLGLSHQSDSCRFYTASAIHHWEGLSENELKSITRQLKIEKSPKIVKAIVNILSSHPQPAVLDEMQQYFENCSGEFLFDLILALASSEKPQFHGMIGTMLKKRFESIKSEDVGTVGQILGLIYKGKPESLIQGLSSPSDVFRLCCLEALDKMNDRKIAFAIMDNLPLREHPEVVNRAVRILSRYFFSEDFRLKGAVTDYLLNLGKLIVEPLIAEIEQLENEIDRKALIDLIESVGGEVNTSLLRKKDEPRVVLSDDHLDEVLERRKKAMAELEKYDNIIQAAHTTNLAVMFTDVKGFTAFSSKASLSEVMAMLKDHDELLVPIFERHGGKALKKIGDAFLVVYEQTSQALLAAIEVQRKLREHNMTHPEERRLAVRISLHYGSVIKKENDVFGDTVNLASRLEGLGDAFEIVVSETVYQQAEKNIFNFTAIGEHSLKGIAHPVKAYKLAWE